MLGMADGRPPALSLPRVSVVPGAPLARFHAAGKVFLPRGADYIRLNRTSIGGATTRTPSEVPLPAYHSTFSVGKYNRSEAVAA